MLVAIPSRWPSLPTTRQAATASLDHRQLYSFRSVRPCRRRRARPCPCGLTRPSAVSAQVIGVVMWSARPPGRAPDSWSAMRRGLGRVLPAPTRGRVAHDVFGVDSGLYVLRTAERPIGLNGDAPGSGP